MAMSSGKADKIAKMCMAADAAIADMLKEAASSSCSTAVTGAGAKPKAEQPPLPPADFQVIWLRATLRHRCHALGA
jgi:hypothetical protein